MEQILQKLPQLLLGWYEQHRRELPWRVDRDPYHVWLSEIMLQQTRVEAVRGYYTRFLAELSSIEALANCPQDRLMKLWEGLGYYSRARNLQKAAQIIMTQHGGVFPSDYASIRALPGVGDYTAGAISSICFELAQPAVDGNVLRVLSRVLDDAAPVTKPAVKKAYSEKLQQIYPNGQCGNFTQSLMELGATVCVPNGAPHCDACPLASLCLAKSRRTQHLRPVKEPKRQKRTEEKTVFVLRCGKYYAVRKRDSRGLLAGLWELPNVDGMLEAQAAIRQAEHWGVHPRELLKSLEKVHVFTHIRWQMRCYYMDCDTMADGFEWVDQTRFEQDVALPTAFRMFWDERDL